MKASIDAKDEERREKVRHLHAVDADTGELADDAPSYPEALDRIRKLELELEGMEEAHKSAMAKVRELRRDKEAQARADGLWPLAVEAFKYWQAVTGHGRSEFNAKRFELVRPHLKKLGIEYVKLAIDGAGYQPYHADKPNRNGKVEVYDDWETIFKSPASVKRHANRAPIERIREVKRIGAVPPIDVLDLRIKAEVILSIELADDPRPMPEKVAIALEEARRELETRRRDRVRSRET